MNQIHDLNGYTIDDSIYQGLVLLFNSLILSYIKTYLQTASSQRNSFLLCRIFSSISTLYSLSFPSYLLVLLLLHLLPLNYGYHSSYTLQIIKN